MFEGKKKSEKEQQQVKTYLFSPTWHEQRAEVFFIFLISFPISMSCRYVGERSNQPLV
jgi:hypothetical protein